MQSISDYKKIVSLARLVRYFILRATTAAGSGHPSSSLSATDLLTALFFGGFFRADLEHPEYPGNDRLIFSKGHASPLFYSIYAAAGRVSEAELLKLRTFHSPLEGHPTPRFPYTEAATGSLGQGLSVGLGMALAARLQQWPYRTFVLLGDSEMSEGAGWEAIQLAAHYRLDNLIGIIDVNRLGQRGETMYGHRLNEYQRRIAAFGWRTMVVDGHNLKAIAGAYQRALTVRGRPVMIIAKTKKGRGVRMIENKNGWHGKALTPDELTVALKQLGKVDADLRGEVALPAKVKIPNAKLVPSQAKEFKTNHLEFTAYKIGDKIATRRAYGTALAALYPKLSNLVVLDAEVSNSTMAEIFKAAHPERFLEMFIAEQNMAGVAVGLSRRGFTPFVSSFAAFLTRAFDQIRLSQYSDCHIVFCGSHAGVAIGEDGPSQMGLEDIAMFRTLRGSSVLYPSDAVATERLVAAAAGASGLVYLRTTRQATPVIYQPTEKFAIGGSKILRQSRKDIATVIAAGITVFEALTAYEILKREGILIRVIDLYSIKPIDLATLRQAASDTKALITVEDHYPEGGLGEAVQSALNERAPTKNFSCPPIRSLAVRQIPRSGKPAELLAYEEINAAAVVKTVKSLL
ncbi:MAG: transketolase [Candidatus Magasanikbacteria bacterium]|nr:transketolase [Candidatus Magasanikbacteria bacterium]